MARNRNNDDDSYLHLSSTDNLEEQAQIAMDLSDEVTSHFERKWGDAVSRIERRINSLASQVANNEGASPSNSGNRQDPVATRFDSMFNALETANKAKNKQGRDKGQIAEDIIKNVLNQTGAGQKFDVNWKSVGLTIGQAIVTSLSHAFSTYVTKPIQSAMTDMSSAYESNFTDIAGRMGYDRKETYAIMKSAVSELNKSSYKRAINANKELIPELRSLSARGWKGSEAVSMAITNTVDRKIMPWLDNSSAAWDNIRYTLDDNTVKTLKSQQLLLQESRAGNKLLQSGVVNQLLTDISPVLSNIDYNTVDKSKMNADLLTKMEAFRAQGYTEDQAYKQAQKALDIYRNPTNYINSDKAVDVLKASETIKGGDISSQAKVDQYFSKIAGGLSIVGAGFYGKGVGLETGQGGSRPEDFKQLARAIENEISKEGLTDFSKASPGLYESIAEKAAQKVTATQAYDNGIQNDATGLAYFVNRIPHGVDTLDNISKTVGLIFKALIGKVIGDQAIKAGAKLLPKLLAKFGTTAAAETATSVAAGAAETAAAGGATAATGAAETAAAGATAGGAGATLAGSLTSLGGGSIVAGAATAAAPVVAGTAIGAYGVKKGYDDIKEGDHKARGVTSMLGGIAAGAGGIGVAGGMIAAGAVNAWNPVGWGLLAAGAVTVLCTSIHRAATALDESQKVVKKNCESISEAYNQEIEDRKKSSKEIIDQLSKDNVTESDKNEARQFLIDQGIASQAEAQKMNAEQLADLTKAYLNATNQMGENDKKAQKEAKDGAVKAAKENNKNVKDALYNNAESIAKQASNDLTSTEEGQQYVSLVDNMIQNITDEKQRTKLQQKWEKQKSDGVSLKEWKGMMKAVSKKEGYSVSGVIAAANYSGIDLGDDIKTEEQISKEYTDYQTICQELANNYRTYKAEPTKQLVATMLNEFQELGKLKDAIDDKTRNKIIKEGGYNLNEIAQKLASEGYKVPEYRVGIDYVPSDRLALIHKAEAVLPSTEAKSYRNMKSVLSRILLGSDFSKPQDGDASEYNQFSIIKEAFSPLLSKLFSKNKKSAKEKSSIAKYFENIASPLASSGFYSKGVGLEEGTAGKRSELYGIHSGLYGKAVGLETGTKSNRNLLDIYKNIASKVVDTATMPTRISIDNLKRVKDGITHVISPDDMESNANKAIDTVNKVSNVTNSNIDVTEIVNELRSQTKQLNETLIAILKASQSNRGGNNVFDAASQAISRISSFNPATSNTRNLYST